MSSSVAYWDSRAALTPEKAVGYAGVDFDQHERFVKRLLGCLVQAGHKILDVGCGYGRFAPTVALLGGEWYGVDFSPAMYYRWAERPRGKFFHCDARQIHPLVSGHAPYDLILCVGSNGSMGLDVDAFTALYAPLLRLPGQVAVVGAHLTSIRSFFTKNNQGNGRADPCREQT